MGYLDRYGKDVLREAAGDAFLYCGPSVMVDYGDGRPCRIDGTIGDSIAVEVESSYSRQVRGAILDLLFHPYPQKLLILLPKNMYDCAACAYRCRLAFGRFLESERFRVVVLDGTLGRTNAIRDTQIVRAALSDLGFETTDERDGSRQRRQK